MVYTRENPSPRYLELTSMYREMHLKGEKFLNIPADKTFPGLSLPPQAPRIKRLIEATGAQTILDYGSGKGKQYDTSPILIEGQEWENILDYWDIAGVTCYDPCYPPFSILPKGKFDGVISTDVLEHCPEDDIPWILDEIFSYARFFVFTNVACYPAKKRLPNGENAHCTIRPLEWWQEQVEYFAQARPDLAWEIWIQSLDSSSGKPTDQRLRSMHSVFDTPS